MKENIKRIIDNAIKNEDSLSFHIEDEEDYKEIYFNKQTIINYDDDSVYICEDNEEESITLDYLLPFNRIVSIQVI